MKHLIFLLSFLPAVVWAQVPNDGFPDRTGKTAAVNLVYTDKAGKLVSESFAAPVLQQDFGKVGYLSASAIDADRTIERLPTYGLARFHWWLFGFEILPHSQRDFSKCLGENRAYEELLNISPKLDEPGSPIYLAIRDIEHYQVPFEAMQRFDNDFSKPPGLEEAKAHARVAIDSINLTVANRIACEARATVLKNKLIAERAALQAEIARLKRRKR